MSLKKLHQTRLSESQKNKLKKAFESNYESITIRLTFTDLHGEDVIAVTKSQIDRLMKAYEAKKGMIIQRSKTQLAYNMKIEGGFLPMLAGLIPFLTRTVLPALGVGALSGMASTGFQKLIGNGLYLNPLDAGRRYTGFAQTSVQRQKPIYRVCANFPTAPETGIPGLRKLPNGARNRYIGFIF